MTKSLEFREAVREALGNRSMSGAATAADLPKDAIRYILMGHEPKLSRAAEVANALGFEFYLGPPRAEPEGKEDPEWITLLLDTLEEHHRGLREDLRRELREDLLQLLHSNKEGRPISGTRTVEEDQLREV